MTAQLSAFGEQLRKWRQARQVSQLHLAVETGVSSRHLSFIETGRSKPSREMVLLLADHLRMPLRAQNALLIAAGFVPAFEQHDLAAPEMDGVRQAVDLVLKSQEPFPAIAVDRKWDVIASNCGAPLLADGVAPELLTTPINVYRLSLHPNGLRSRIVNFAEYARHMLSRLRHDAAVSADAGLHELLHEIESYPDVLGAAGTAVSRGHVVLPLVLTSKVGELTFITTIATFGTPLDITVADLAIETFLPGNEETAERVRLVHPKQH